MKRLLTIFASLLFCLNIAFSQDIITTKTGEIIQARDISIEKDNVRFKQFSNPNSPTYSYSKADILLIEYQSGKRQAFGQNIVEREAVEGLTRGMSYKELSQIYRTEEYIPGTDDRYSVPLSGICSILVPGLGQMICGETNRGLCFLGGDIAGWSMYYIGARVRINAMLNGKPETLGSLIMYVGLIGAVGVSIWSTIDAVNVAKVMNMYNRDLRKGGTSVSLAPSFDLVPSVQGYQPTAGATLAFTF